MSGLINDYYDGMLGNTTLDEEIFELALSKWTERSLLNDYDRREIQFFDALIWTRVIKEQEHYEMLKNNKSHFYKDLENSINTWKYTGKIYRVIDCNPSKLEYHNMIASWTSDLEVFNNFNHLNKDRKYTFIVGAARGKNWGFDVNKYRSIKNIQHKFTEHEAEIIFPMNNKYIKDIFYGTLKGFYQHIGCKKLINIKEIKNA